MLSVGAGPSDWVDMRIGTARANGSNVLGPCIPHGSTHPSPDSAWPSPHERPKDAKHGFGPPTSGWWPGDEVVGFSQLHAQGTGGTPSYGIFRYVCEPDDMDRVGDRPRETCVLQGFPRFQPSERHRDRVAAPRSGCYGAGAETGGTKGKRTARHERDYAKAIHARQEADDAGGDRRIQALAARPGGGVS